MHNANFGKIYNKIAEENAHNESDQSDDEMEIFEAL